MKKNYFLILIVLGFFSCQKEVSTELSNTNTSSQVDVYVAGLQDDDVSPFVTHYFDTEPIYWKNGNPVKLEFVTGYFASGDHPLSIAVSGNDVYVAGYKWAQNFRGDHIEYKYWKNGISEYVESRNNYPREPSRLNSIAISNNDIYMAGFNFLWSGEAASYYKNGTPIDLSDGLVSSTATSIAVSGNDIYVAGYENGVSGYVAKYWKNGSPVNLTDGSKDVWTTSIAVSGTDVYVAGNDEDSVAKYWKNRTMVNLTNGSTGAEANSIAVSGTDVYVAGTQWDGSLSHNPPGYYNYRNPIAKYWKNGNPVNLTDGSKWAEAKSIAVSGNDVYVAGYEEKTAGTQVFVAKYWKNGTPVILGDVSKYSEAWSIFLVKK